MLFLGSFGKAIAIFFILDISVSPLSLQWRQLSKAVERAFNLNKNMDNGFITLHRKISFCG